MQKLQGISKAAFWDADFDALDIDEHKIYIIGKVFSFGTLEDVKSLYSFYNEGEIKNALLQSNVLDPKTLTLAANLFNVDKSEFACYKRIQLLRSSGSYYNN